MDILLQAMLDLQAEISSTLCSKAEGFFDILINLDALSNAGNRLSLADIEVRNDLFDKCLVTWWIKLSNKYKYFPIIVIISKANKRAWPDWYNESLNEIYFGKSLGKKNYIVIKLNELPKNS